jgi:hypothetical protein
MIERGDEDNGWGIGPATNPLEDIESIAIPHPDVEQDNVRSEPIDTLNRLLAGTCLSDQFGMRHRLKQQPKPPQRQDFVIDRKNS